MRRRVLSIALLLSISAACGGSDDARLTPDAGDDASIDPADFAKQDRSCAYDCTVPCAESTTPYACPSTGDWAKIPHDTACGAWNGTYPTPAAGKCTASAPSGEAAKYAGPDTADPATTILPDGRRIRPAGSHWVFQETDLSGGLTSLAAAIPGTSLVVTVDTGPVDHAVRIIDSSKPAGASPVASYVKFANPATLSSAIAFVAPDLLYVATADGIVQALKLDTTTGVVAKDDARSIKLPPSKDGNGNTIGWYASGLAASPDGRRLIVTGVTEKHLLVYDVASGSATFGQKLGEVDLGGSETFGVWLDPNDATAKYAYVSMWADRAVVEVDVSSGAAPMVARRFATDKDPQGIAFLDARWMAIANDLGDTLSLVDRTTGTVTSVPIDTRQALHGAEPSTVAYDATAKRLYVTLSGIDAIGAYDVDLAPTPPTITPAGRLPTGWWPSGVVVLPDGSLVVANLRGRGTGPRPMHWAIGDADIDARMRGSVQHIAKPQTGDLTTGDATVAKNTSVATLAGAPTVTCPQGADDFPIPTTNTTGPSKILQHVFFIVRENKGFDGLFGDFAGVEGKPDYLLKPGAGEMDGIWQNLRTLARQFAISDNYYTDAIYSTQGHVWTTWGRTNDFNERTWAISGSGRSVRVIPGGGVIDVGRPAEGSLFDWLHDNGVVYDLLGEIVGGPTKDDPMRPAVDGHYPGGPFQNIGYNDLEKACYTAGRAKVLCNLGNFVYMTLPNDHTFGVSASRPLPETFCAVNDEATGMIVDAITHSPLWSSSIIFITEDDPSQGGEHIDSHRAPLAVISPWAKRGYVSKTHIDVASLHKLFAHVLGKPYRNASIANASVPFDLFTSTPDYTPFTYKTRTWPLACGMKGTLGGEQSLSDSWDTDEVDEQPGLDAQVTRWMRGTPFQTLPPKLAEAVSIRNAQRRLSGP